MSIFGLRIDFLTQIWVLGRESGIGHRVEVCEFVTQNRFLRSASCVDFVDSGSFLVLRIEICDIKRFCK